MTLAEIVVITGMPGLYKLVAKRNDGLVVTSLLDDKTTFVSGRKHLFTTLDNVTMYNTGEGISLKAVLAEMKKQEAHNPPVIQDDKNARAYFEKIVPDYDREKVYVSDIKKLIKWYEILNNKNLIEELIKSPSENGNEPTEDEPLLEKAEEKPAIKSAAAENIAKTRKEVKSKSEKNVKVATKPAPAAKKISAPRKAQ
jgi:hypothetical protein